MSFIAEARHQESGVVIHLCGFGYFTPAAFLKIDKEALSSPVIQLLSATAAFVQMSVCVCV